MKLFMKIIGLFVLSITSLTAIVYFTWYRPKFNGSHKNFSFHEKANTARLATGLRLKEKAKSLHDCIEAGNYSRTICFLVDMRINSGKQRFFVYNLEKDSVEMAGLVTHGSGSGSNDEDIYFSNEPGSNCTSLGKYKIGRSYKGKFGLAYKLYGLDKTNDNAFERFVVLHAHSCVPNEEVYPLPICESWGCPTVSPSFLQTLRKYIDSAEKPILLNIYK
jgi:hypothetical protein